MRKTIALLLVLLSLAPCAARVEGAPLPDARPHNEMLYLPKGSWTFSLSGLWRFRLSEDIYLVQWQRDIARGMGFLVEDDMLRAGQFLAWEDLAQLYPGMEALLKPPSPSAQRTEPAPEPAGGDAGTAISSAPPKTLPGVLPTIRPVLQGQGTAPANGKTIYLTIGDAPSPTTAELLAVLDELNVKATFFVVGSYVRKWPDALRAIYEHGHTIGNHAYSYDLQVLNASFSACLHDFQRAERMVADVLGFELPMPLLRIPYGSSKIPPLYRTRLQEEGYLWLDWNALNGDTESATKSDDDVIRRAISTAGRVEGDIVLLVNDNKQRTIRTLPAIVSHFREAGYVFRTLDYNTLEKIPDVRMGLPIKKQ